MEVSCYIWIRKETDFDLEFQKLYLLYISTISTIHNINPSLLTKKIATDRPNIYKFASNDESY